MRVHQCGKQIVRRGDGVKIAVEMKGDFRAGPNFRRSPAARAALNPNPGAGGGSRGVNDTFLPIWRRPCLRLNAVTVLASTAAVGVVAVTMISLPRRLKEG